jgi:DNA-directed RNA polymerase subunit M/transcription elongation factor TFIIS
MIRTICSACGEEMIFIDRDEDEIELWQCPSCLYSEEY